MTDGGWGFFRATVGDWGFCLGFCGLSGGGRGSVVVMGEVVGLVVVVVGLMAVVGG